MLLSFFFFFRFFSLCGLKGRRGDRKCMEQRAVVCKRGSDECGLVPRIHPKSGTSQPQRGAGHRFAARLVLEEKQTPSLLINLSHIFSSVLRLVQFQWTSWPTSPGGRAACRRHTWSERGVTWTRSESVTLWILTWTPTNLPGSSESYQTTKVSQKESITYLHEGLVLHLVSALPVHSCIISFSPSLACRPVMWSSHFYLFCSELHRRNQECCTTCSPCVPFPFLCLWMTHMIELVTVCVLQLLWWATPGWPPVWSQRLHQGLPPPNRC